MAATPKTIPDTRPDRDIYLYGHFLHTLFFFFPLSLSLLFHYCYYWKRGVWKRSVTWAYRKFAMRPHPKCICQTKENLYDTEIIVTTEMNKNNTILQVVRYWQTSATKSKHFRWMKERTTYSLKFINVWVCCWVNMLLYRTRDRIRA